MYFFVDESGHTGTNLFDENQPVLSYGVLSAKINLDVLAQPKVKKARSKLGVKRLHANELGFGGLIQIIDELAAIQKKYSPRFDLYRVAKPDHAIICFFDQVFDQGMNPAVGWIGYWTPMRYVYLAKLASLFDEDLAKRAWEARIQINDAKAEASLKLICEELLGRVEVLPDERSRQVIGDALRWAKDNPEKLHYNCKSKKEILAVTPNIIGFQFVMHGIATRTKNPDHARKIVIDRQSQFNKAQKTLAEFYDGARGVDWAVGPGMPKMDLSNIPKTPLSFVAGTDSVGLELVDIYLWLFKQIMEGKEIPQELAPVVEPQLRRGVTDEISINALNSKWSKVLQGRPEPTGEGLKKARELSELDEKRRQDAIRK
jgi:hypothetical protein